MGLICLGWTVKLSNPEPRYSIAIRKRVDEILDGGCSCGGESGGLRRRLVNAHVTIHLQCETCGRSVSGSLPRAEFYFWQSYPEWNAELSERYWRGGHTQAERSAAIRQAGEERRAEYYAWLDESPEWQQVRRLVLNRAEDVCEACLIAPAVQVHHLTYSYGKIPPAWELRAVCRGCHERLHNEWREGARHEEVHRRVREILG